MVGLAVEMTRSSRSLEQISNLYNACFQPDRKVPGIPMVPGLGLYLDELFFEKYNLKLKYDDEKRERAALNKQRRGESGAQEEEKEDTSISVSPSSLLSHPTVYPTLSRCSLSVDSSGQVSPPPHCASRPSKERSCTHTSQVR
jgi:hypothetical protein